MARGIGRSWDGDITFKNSLLERKELLPRRGGEKVGGRNLWAGCRGKSAFLEEIRLCRREQRRKKNWVILEREWRRVRSDDDRGNLTRVFESGDRGARQGGGRSPKGESLLNPRGGSLRRRSGRCCGLWGAGFRRGNFPLRKM